MRFPIKSIIFLSIAATFCTGKNDYYIILKNQRTLHEIDRLYEKLPPEVKAQLNKFKDATHADTMEKGQITEEDKQKILEDIDTLFKGGTGEDGN